MIPELKNILNKANIEYKEGMADEGYFYIRIHSKEKSNVLSHEIEHMWTEFRFKPIQGKLYEIHMGNL